MPNTLPSVQTTGTPTVGGAAAELSSGDGESGGNSGGDGDGGGGNDDEGGDAGRAAAAVADAADGNERAPLGPSKASPIKYKRGVSETTATFRKIIEIERMAAESASTGSPGATYAAAKRGCMLAAGRRGLWVSPPA